MLSEHNPIAELIYQVQKKWIDEVSPFPELKLVRWIIKPEEARLFEGFLKLESTEYGAIPEVLVTMLTPFKSDQTHADELVADWKKAFEEDHKTLDKLLAKKLKNKWNDRKDESSSYAYETNPFHSFINMLSGFHTEMVGKETRLVVALFPYTVYDMNGYRRWLVSILEQEIPGEISFMIFDHVGEYYFDSIFKKYPDCTKSLNINLDMDGAVSKIAKMGNPNAPEVQLRECILEMGHSVQRKDKQRVALWGEKALRVTQKSQSKSLYATAHIVYAGMLFNFKHYKKIDELLARGLAITKKGLMLNDGACKPLLIQYHGYIAASAQLQKRLKDAVTSYEKQGDAALEFQLAGMALTPYRQAYTLSRKKLPERSDELINKAFSAGMSLPHEEQLNSSFPGIAMDYLLWLESRKKWQEATQMEQQLNLLLGTGWKEQASNPAAPYTAVSKQSTALI